MQNSCQLSQQAMDYLSRFHSILDEMITGMTGASLNQSISHNFIVQMIPHHRAAIEMSHNILQYTENHRVRQIASNIITAQTKSIADMQAVEAQCSSLTNSPQELQLYQRRMELIFSDMFSRMGRAPEDNCLARVFMQEMIPHHQGAIHMSENTLKYDICGGLKPILRAIITSQRQGVQEMQALLCTM